MDGKLESRRKSVDTVFKLYEKHGDSNYLGEAVSKTQHSLQCAMLAQKAGSKPEVVLGALFHDIGHLVGLDKGMDRMVSQDGADLGTKDHDTVGEQFLKDLGFPSSVTSFVKGHVQAKRYLVTKPEYYNSLSEASRLTLLQQGGPMTDTEAQHFEEHPMFDELVKMRRWDELAKDPGCTTEPLQKYQDMAYNYCTNYGSNFQ